MTKEIRKCYRSNTLNVSLLALTFLSMAFSPQLLGQSATTGALTGTVRDSSGAVIPNATVTVTSIATGQARTTATSGSGTYTVGFLPPGNYQVKFEASGFTAVSVPSVTVNVTETPELDQVLSVGSQAQQVEVRGEAEMVQTTSSTVGTVVAGDTLTDLPLTSRNYTTLLGLTAGSNVGVFDAAALGRGTQDIAVNGSSTFQNNYQQDGSSLFSYSGHGLNSDGNSNLGVGIVNPDSIQEYKIQTSLFDASYGRNPGANVNVVTKAGTNQFHGTVFEFFRNTVLNANDFFRKISPPVGGVPNDGRQVLNQNQFGGVLGGPVKKDKLFFFAAYQETRQINGISSAGFSDPSLVGIPAGSRSTAAFRSALGAAFCPGGSATTGTTGKTQNGGTQVACNGSNINQVALNILNLKLANGSYYVPSSSTGLNQNVTYSLPARFTEHQAVGNVDYVLNDHNTLTGRWFYANDPTFAPMGCGAATSGSTLTLCLPGGPGTILIENEYAVLKLTSILTNNLVNEARFAPQRDFLDPTNGVPFTDTQVGISPILPSYNVLDTITVSGLFQMGGVFALGSGKATSSWAAADQISWSHGKHTIRAGFEYDRLRNDVHLPGFNLGSLTFPTFQDFLLGLPGCSPSLSAAACAASAAAGLTNGSSTSNISNSGAAASVTPPGGLVHYLRNPEASAFVQDDFKIRSNLTLNLGLRWEYDGMLKDTGGLLSNVWPSLAALVPVPGPTPATGTLAGFVVPSNFNFAEFPAPPVGGVFQNNRTISIENNPPNRNFAPRVGFAWKPFASDRFVVRGGGGYFYDFVGQHAYDQSSAQGQPYSVTVGASGAANVNSSFAQPYNPAITVGWLPRWVNINTATQSGTSANLNTVGVGPIYLTPLTYQWNLNTQYEFLPSWVLEVGYVGSRGIHQVPDLSASNRNVNQALLASPTDPLNGITTNTVANASVRVPYLGFAPSGLGLDLTDNDTKFNSLQVTVRKQMSHGLEMQAAYTYARSFDTSYSDGYNNPLIKVYGLNQNYRPQRLAINYSWNIPFGQHDGFMGKVANGWSLAGVTIVQDGTALTVVDSRGGSIYGFGPGSPVSSTAEFAAGMGSANVGTAGGVQQRLGGATGGLGYFNKAAFGLTPVIGNGTGYGDAGLGIILGPGEFNFDATIQKVTKVGGLREDATLVFRAEFFNAFNHPQFNNPTGSQLDFSNSQFGQITSTSVNPRLIQFALKYAF